MEELLRQAAFGDDPGAGRLLRGKAGSGRERLLAGILAGAEGRYATAATLFQQLMRGGDRVLAAHAAAGFAAHRRQLGGHGAALGFDGLAVAWATTDLGKCGPRGSGGLGADELDADGLDADGLDAEGALVDGLLGLAADNLGLGRLRAARLLRAKAGRLLGTEEASSGERAEVERLLRGKAGRLPRSGEAEAVPARDVAGERPEAAQEASVGEHAATRGDGERRLPAEARSRGWRGRIRAGWIGAEIELAAGNAQAALPPAEQAAELARACGAVRHGIKSDLVLAAALTAAGDSAGRERALDLVRNARLAAEKYELRSLIWPAALISADLVPANGHLHRSRADTVLHAVLLRADPGGRRLARESPWVPV